MWYVARDKVDEVFMRLAETMEHGLLGHCIKVPGTLKLGEGKAAVFIVYTKDFQDRDDVLRVGLKLREVLEIKRTFSYKPGN